MMEQTAEPFYHVLDTNCSAAFSASLDRLSPSSNGNAADCSFYGSEHESIALSPQSPQLGRSVPILSSPEENELILQRKASNGPNEEANEQGEKSNNKHSSQSSVYYAQIIYEEYEKMKRDKPDENGTCRRVPLMINPVPSSKSKKHSSSNTSGGSNTSVHTSGSNSSLRVFKRAGSGLTGTGNYSDTMENGSGGGMSHNSPPNSGGSSADQYDIQGLSLPPQVIKTLPAVHHRPSKSHTTTFGHHSIAGFHQHQHSTQFHPEFATLSSRPVLPPPPPPPVPPISHIPSASVIVDPTQSIATSTFVSHPRTQSFTLRDRPLPQRPDSATISPAALSNRNQTSHIPRSVTPEPSRRRPKKPPQVNHSVNDIDSSSAARQFKTLPNNRKVVRENCMNINWNPGSNVSTPARSKRKHSVPNEKMMLSSYETDITNDFDESNVDNAINRLSQQPQTPSKFSSTFSTLKRLLKRDKTPSRSDANSRHNKSAGQSPAMQRGNMTLSVFRDSGSKFETDVFGSQEDELAYDVQSLPLVSWLRFFLYMN